MSLLGSFGFVVTHPLNRNQRFRALFRVLKWQIGSRLVPGQVAFEWINGTRFLVERGETGLTGNVYCGLHEFSEMAFVLHVLGPEDCFVDVGANVGSYTLLACGVRGATGHSFEPVPSTFRRLENNINLNRLTGRVTAHNCALGDQDAQLKFSVGENCMNHVASDGEECAHFATVKVTSMDSVLRGVSPSLIKIDVEGFETAVLRGGRSTLSKESLHSVIMEINGSGNRYGFDDAALVEIMTSHGFRECEYDPFSRRLTEANRAGNRSGNSIFVRDLEKVRSRIAHAPRFDVAGREL